MMDTDQKGRMGEEMVRSAFTMHGYKVIPTGIEHTEAVDASDKWVRQSLLFNILNHAPDFLVTKKVAERTEHAFIESKYRPSVSRLEDLDDRFEKMLVDNYLGFPLNPDEADDCQTQQEFFKKEGEEDLHRLRKYRTHQKGAHVFSDALMVIITKCDVSIIRIGDLFFAGARTQPSGLHATWRDKKDLPLNDPRYGFIAEDWKGIKDMILHCLKTYGA